MKPPYNVCGAQNVAPDGRFVKPMGKALRSNGLRGTASEWLKKALRESEGPTHGRWSISALAAKAHIARATI